MVDEEKAVRVAELLIKYGADVNARGEFTNNKAPLHYAVEKGWLKMVAVLLRNGASPNIEDDFGRTPLYGANDKLLEIVRAHSQQAVEEKQRPQAIKEEAMSFETARAFSGSQCSVFVHNITNNGWRRIGGAMVGSSHYAEHYSDGKSTIKVATSPSDQIWFLSFTDESANETIHVLEGKGR
jgi:hypothetical protein